MSGLSRHARKQAIAVKGAEKEQMAPAVAARGTGCLADKIIALAREHNIPIREDPDLVSLLAKLDLEQSLPVELYPLLAELLGFAYNLNQAAAGTGAQEQPARPVVEEEGIAQFEVETGDAEMDALPLPPALPDQSADSDADTDAGA